MNSVLRNGFLYIVCLLSGFSSAQAREDDYDWIQLPQEKGPRIWMGFEIGATAPTSDNQTNTTYMPNPPLAPLPDDYKETQRDGNLLLSALVGYEWDFDKEKGWFPSVRLALGYEYLTSSDVKANINKYQEETYYDYQYHIYSNVIWLDGQLDLFQNFLYTYFVPFIDVGVGVAFNTSSGYDEMRISTDVPVRQSADFENETTTSFAWRAGLGLDYRSPEFKGWTLGIIARYSDLGDARTGKSETYPSIGDLDVSLENMEALFILRYTF